MASPDPSDGATAALVAYLRSEADAAEARARSLRLQIAQLSATYNISDDMQQRYGTYTGLQTVLSFLKVLVFK